MQRMASRTEVTSMAVFCDFENVALGVQDAKYEKFDIKRVLERLLLKGSIVVKKAYCDWERYKAFKASMHEASFELIEIPHVRQAGKNSADIRLVVDALDLCYTKAHVDTFVIVSGDSDFSPLVSKLRENDKTVIGVGVKNSTSDLLIANCDEFIFYDDLVREQKRRTGAAKAGGRSATPRKAEGRTGARSEAKAEPAPDAAGEPKAGAKAPARRGRGARAKSGTEAEAAEAPVAAETSVTPETPVAAPVAVEAPVAAEVATGARRGTRARRGTKKEAVPAALAEPETAGLPPENGASSEPTTEEVQRTKAVTKVVETVEALLAERGDADAIWGSMVKQTLKRRQPGFNESYYGFKSFNALLEEAQARGLLIITRDEKSGGYTVRPAGG
jgi:uncharacterized protein (TIGR00288 family)